MTSLLAQLLGVLVLLLLVLSMLQAVLQNPLALILLGGLLLIAALWRSGRLGP